MAIVLRRPVALSPLQEKDISYKTSEAQRLGKHDVRLETSFSGNDGL
jgi:hypothetical protein